MSSRKGETQADILSVTSANGFVRSLDVFDKQVFSKDTSSYKLVRFNDIAYNPSRINVGSVARCDLPEGGAVSPMYVVVRCQESILPQYLIYFLKSVVGRQHINHRSVGAVRFQLRFADLEQIELPVPPISEQERIVQILSEAEALCQLRAQVDTSTERVVRHLFFDFFGDPVRNTRLWPQSTIGEQLALLEYGPRFYNESYSVTGPMIVRITDLDMAGNLSFGTMPRQDVDSSTLAARGLNAGDLIFARTGATVGKVALVPPDAPPCIAGAYFIRLRFRDAIEPVFAVELLRSAPIQDIVARQSTQSAQQNFSGPLIRALPMPLPPSELQRSFALQVAKLRSLQAAQGLSQMHLVDLSQSLAYHAFG